MHKTCEWLVINEPETVGAGCGLVVVPAQGNEVPCGKPANFIIDWGNGVVYWYCAEHYEMRIKVVQDAGRDDVLRKSG